VCRPPPKRSTLRTGLRDGARSHRVSRRLVEVGELDQFRGELGRRTFGDLLPARHRGREGSGRPRSDGGARESCDLSGREGRIEEGPPPGRGHATEPEHEVCAPSPSSRGGANRGRRSQVQDAPRQTPQTGRPLRMRSTRRCERRYSQEARRCRRPPRRAAILPAASLARVAHDASRAELEPPGTRRRNLRAGSESVR
jgi:hypothetical protein